MIQALRRQLAEGTPLPRRVHAVLGLWLPLALLSLNLWRVHAFTVDDAYISFRYARNLAEGLGLVYNPGERIEGYSNFSWTLMLAGGMKLGVDPHVTSKVAGSLAAMATLGVAYRFSARLQPLATLPCIATWLLATSPALSGHSVFGLETGAFSLWVILGAYLMHRELGQESRLPWSGLVFALAGLTRPEAPLYLVFPMLLLGRRLWSRQNLIRMGLFASPLIAHELWRWTYYGMWFPATFRAKTGDLQLQLAAGRIYVSTWLAHAGPILLASVAGFTGALAKRDRPRIALGLQVIVISLYVVAVGGDWMRYDRFLAPAEPFAFILACVAIRGSRMRAPLILGCIGLFLVGAGIWRVSVLRSAQKTWLVQEKLFWDNAAGQTARWLSKQPQPGRVALGDIGAVGYRTGYPILDLVGIVDPVIGTLPGGYAQKLGPAYVQRFFDADPRYAVLIMSGVSCTDAGHPGVVPLIADPRFVERYTLAHNIQITASGGWCIFARNGVD